MRLLTLRLKYELCSFNESEFVYEYQQVVDNTFRNTQQ